MNNDELKFLFDQQAPNYDNQWARMTPINNGLYFLLESVFAELPSDARILCVGVGTGKEIIHLARKFPDWHFTAVEPSSAMFEMFRQAATREGVASRCYFHEGYLDSLPTETLHDAATCFLVSHFILNKDVRAQFFQQIATRLKPGGILANSDLSSDTASEEFEPALKMWQTVMSGAGLSPEELNRIKAAYAKDVAILPPSEVATIIKTGGFDTPVKFYQAGLINAWFSKRTFFQ